MINLTSKRNKVKIAKPKITCRKQQNGKKYYGIEYFDAFANEYCFGYASYCKKFVKGWLRNEFIAVPKIDIEAHGGMKQETANG